MTEVRRPPWLRIRHQGSQVLDHGVEVETLELLGVVERLAHRIRQAGVAMKDRNIQLGWPPVAVAMSSGERALARALVSLCVHISLRSCSVVFFESFPQQMEK